MNNYDKAKIDPECLPLVEYFNRHGLTTAMSCQGHNNTNMSMYWIDLPQALVKKTLSGSSRSICLAYWVILHPTGGLPCACIWLWMITDAYVLLKGWHYFAATVDAAFEDLEQWKSYDNRRKE